MKKKNKIQIEYTEDPVCVCVCIHVHFKLTLFLNKCVFRNYLLSYLYILAALLCAAWALCRGVPALVCSGLRSCGSLA